MTDSARIRKIIADKGLKLKYIAQKLGISPYALKMKLNNESEFKASEVSLLCDILDIHNLEEKEHIFFANL